MPTAGYAYALATNAHTGLHQAIHELRHGSVTEAKQLLARQIAGESECADGAVRVRVQGRLRGLDRCEIDADGSKRFNKYGVKPIRLISRTTRFYRTPVKF